MPSCAVRSKGAGVCQVSWKKVVLGPGLLRVADDGCVLPVPSREKHTGAGGGGNGLRNLRERVAALGGVLEAGPVPDGRGYVLTVRLDSASVSLPG